jgi:hypothetical protein
MPDRIQNPVVFNLGLEFPDPHFYYSPVIHWVPQWQEHHHCFTRLALVSLHFH